MENIIKKSKTMSVYALVYSINDCKLTIANYPENQNNNYYKKEIEIYGNELNDRHDFDVNINDLIKLLIK